MKTQENVFLPLDRECLQNTRTFCRVVIPGTVQVHLTSILQLKESYFNLQSALFISLSPLLPHGKEADSSSATCFTTR